MAPARRPAPAHPAAPARLPACLPARPTLPDSPHPHSTHSLFPSSPQGVEVGIVVSVAVSLLLVIYKTAFPRITTLGKLPGTEIYR